MQILATLFVAGLWKYHQSISRAKKPTRCENFVRILDILGASNFETIFLAYPNIVRWGREPLSSPQS